MTQKLCLLAWMLLCLPALRAQTLNDPIYFSHSYLSKGNSNNDQPAQDAQFFELNLAVPPISIGKKIKLINAVYYRNTAIGYEESSPTNALLPATLHDIRYSAIMRIQVSPKWEVVALPRIMIRSDLTQNITGNDFFPQVALLATYAIKGNPDFKIGLGAALNNDFERNAIVPLGSLYYNTKKIKIEIVYPNAHFLYKASPKLEFGLFSTVDGAISRINPYQTSVETANYLRTFQLLVAPTVSRQLYKKIFGHFKIGWAPIRNIETMNKDFDVIKTSRYELQSSLFIRTGISVRLQN